MMPREWVRSPHDGRQHRLADLPDDRRPIGLAIAACGHRMPCSVITNGEMSRILCAPCRATQPPKALEPVFHAPPIDPPE